MRILAAEMSELAKYGRWISSSGRW